MLQVVLENGVNHEISVRVRVTGNGVNKINYLVEVKQKFY